MKYLKKNKDNILDAKFFWPPAESVIVFGIPYSAKDSPGKNIASYAWGRDYHNVLRKIFKKVLLGIQEEYSFSYKICIDSSPLLEKYFAVKSGLGFLGKNTLVLHKDYGSKFFLVCILVDLPLKKEDKGFLGSCGECQRCLLACPTQAFPDAYELDSQKCISYLTIEKTSSLSPNEKNLAGYIFGCDICQDVCPFNQKGKDIPVLKEFLTGGLGPYLSPEKLKTLKAEDLYGTPLKRAGLSKLKEAASLMDARTSESAVTTRRGPRS